MDKKPLIILTGPTAVGKTSLSVRLARAVNGEIISADSMQVYRHMDIGSAKVTEKEMEGVPHHLIDILEPDEEFHVVLFQKLARQAMEEILSRGRIPIVAGGTGFYIQALLKDIDFTESEDSRQKEIRSRLEKAAAAKGGSLLLHDRLREVDPVSAGIIHANNVKRVIRALEFYELTGRPISEHNAVEREKTSPYHFLYYCLNMDRAKLYARIDARVDAMLKAGLTEEVRRLAQMGCSREMVSMQGLGYKEILAWLEGEISLEEAVYRIKRDTRHFAKRQLTWFRREQEVRMLAWEDYAFSEDKVLEKILSDMRGEGMLKGSGQKG